MELYITEATVVEYGKGWRTVQASDVAKKLVLEGKIVLFDSYIPCDGRKGTTLRAIKHKSGNTFFPRMATKEALEHVDDAVKV